MLSAQGTAEIGMARVLATSGRGLNAEEIAEMALNKILFVADTAPPAIREQAQAFRDRLEVVLTYYIRQAQTSQNTTICGALECAGLHDAAELVRTL